ncbi:MAG: methyltransferase domain-containing protein [Bacteroidia bacterium]
MEKLTNCPVCKSADLTSYIQAKDFTVTGEEFNITQCGLCSLRFTNPRPTEQEISKYYQSENYISHTDSNSGFINNIYQKVKVITLNQKLKLINKFVPAPNKKLLDYGCGTGDFMVYAQSGGMDVHGVEPTEEARQKAIGKNLGISSYEDFFQFQKNSFDVITLWHVLEHVHELDKVFTNLCMILKQGGYLFIALPNSNATDASIYDEFWAAFDVPRHLYHFSPLSFDYFIKLYPVKLIEKKSMPFDPFYIALLSEKYKTGKSNFITAFYNGLAGFISGNKAVDKSSSIIYILQRV